MCVSVFCLFCSFMSPSLCVFYQRPRRFDSLVSAAGRTHSDGVGLALHGPMSRSWMVTEAGPANYCHPQVSSLSIFHVRCLTLSLSLGRRLNCPVFYTRLALYFTRGRRMARMEHLTRIMETGHATCDAKLVAQARTIAPKRMSAMSSVDSLSYVHQVRYRGE